MLHAIRMLSHQRPLKVAKGFTFPPRCWGVAASQQRACACLAKEIPNGTADRAPPPSPNLTRKNWQYCQKFLTERPLRALFGGYFLLKRKDFGKVSF